VNICGLVLQLDSAAAITMSWLLQSAFTSLLRIMFRAWNQL